MISVSRSPTDEALRVAMNGAARDNLVPLAAVAVPIYILAGIFRVQMVRSIHDTIAQAEFASAAATAGLLFFIVRWRLTGAWVHPLLFVFGLVAWADGMVQFYFSHSPMDTTNLALIIVASAIVSLSILTSSLLYAVVWAGWYWCVRNYPSGQWYHYGMFLLWTTGIAVAVQTARTRLLLRLFRSESRQRELLEELVAERNRELEESLEHLRHAERLASVGTFAAGIAHEINNPVGMILLSAEQALYYAESNGADSKVSPLLRDISANAKRCGRIVKNVLRFARHDAAERAPADVNAIIRSAVELVHSYAAQRNASIDLMLDVRLPPAVVNQVEMEQVFVNLIQNGIEATSDVAPRITITTSQTAQGIRLTVADNGAGVRPEDRAHIFDPFFTTRQAHGGTGLGLSLVYGIVRDHGGSIRVGDSALGGTEMTIDMPRCGETD